MRSRTFFPQSTASRDFYFGIGGSPTWRITSHAVRDSEWKDYYPAQTPLLGYGLKPYLTPAHAVNHWVFEIDHSAQPGASLQNQWIFVPALPDLRARVISAEWLPSPASLHLARFCTLFRTQNGHTTQLRSLSLLYIRNTVRTRMFIDDLHDGLLKPSRQNP